MKELARAIIDQLLDGWGDLTIVTPAAFATALRVVGRIPDDATPFHIEHWVGTFGIIRVGAASPEIAGFAYSVGDSFVIQTGHGRSPQERNITIPHEFGERLNFAINDELAQRGLPTVDWREQFWDAMGVELVAPRAAFRRMARESGFDLVELAKALSFEAVVYRVKEAFDSDVPLFALYWKNTTKWNRGRGFEGTTWAASAWTRRWMAHSFSGLREVLYIPRRHELISDDSFAAEARRRQRPLLVHTEDLIEGKCVETSVMFRTRSYGRDPAWVLAIGVERRYGHLLGTQVALAGPEERQGSFERLF